MLSSCTSENTRGSCIQKYLDQSYGFNVNNLTSKARTKSYIRRFSDDQLSNLTGCYRPCNSLHFFANKIHDYETIHLNEGERVMSDLKLKNLSHDLSKVSVLILSHFKAQKLKTTREIYDYNWIQFISDAGGIIGIFLGISFWSVHQHLDYFKQ